MAFIDEQTRVSSAQVLTGTAASEDYIDLGVARDVAVGRELYALVTVTSALVGAGAQVAVTVETDDNPSFSSATTTQTLGTLAALAPAGTQIKVRLDLDSVNERYIQLKYTVSGGTLTAGTVDADIGVLDVENEAYYASGYSFVA